MVLGEQQLAGFPSLTGKKELVMYGKGFIAAGVVSAALIVGTVVAQQAASPPTTQPAEAETQMSMDDMMKGCMEHCRVTSRSIEQTTRLIEEAKESDDAARMKAALDQAQSDLQGMKEHMTGCMGMMGRMQRMHGGMMRGMGGIEAPAESAEKSELSALPEGAEQALNDVIQAYLRIGDQLAADKVEGLAPAARALAQGIERLVKVEIPDEPDFWQRHRTQVQTIRERAKTLTGVDDLGEARRAYAELSGALQALVQATGVPPSFDRPVQALTCPMYEGGAVWLQAQDEVRNPYMGQAMLECAGESSVLPVTGAEPARQEPAR